MRFNQDSVFTIEGIKGILQAHEDWQDSPRPEPEPAYFERIINFIAEYRMLPPPPGIRGSMIEAGIARLEAAQLEHDLSEDAGLSDSFIGAIENMRTAVTKFESELRRPMSLESIEALTAQQVPDRQICEMYGWVDNGRAQVEILAKERAVRGSVITSGWIHPQERERQESEASWDRCVKEFHENAAGRTAEKEEASKPKACRETPEELWQIGRDGSGEPLSTSQASQMLCIPEPEVISLWKGFERDRLNLANADKTVTMGTTSEESASNGEADEYETMDTVQLKEECLRAGIGIAGKPKDETLRAKLRAAAAAKSS